MKVLISEHFHVGHHYNFVAHLLPLLTELKHDVVVALTPEGFSSREFETILAPFAGRVSFQPSLPAASPWMPMSERRLLHRALLDVIAQVRPNYVLLPSADGQVTGISLARLTGGGRLPANVPCEAGIHLGSGAGQAGIARWMRHELHTLSMVASGLRKIHIVNVLFLERLLKRHPKGPFVLTPTPVTPNQRLSKEESRRQLGLAEDGRYLGLAGSLDSRKAIPQLLAAFRAAKLGPTDRVLLAGWMSPPHLRCIESEFADLVTDGRLVLLPGFLAPERYRTALTAMDVVCTPYPQFLGLSNTLLESVAAGRPILANQSGWMRAMVERFKLGATCDVLNVPQFSSAIETAFHTASQFIETPAIKALLRFNSPENYARSWVQGLAGNAGLAPLPWSEVAALTGWHSNARNTSH